MSVCECVGVVWVWCVGVVCVGVGVVCVCFITLNY